MTSLFQNPNLVLATFDDKYSRQVEVSYYRILVDGSHIGGVFNSVEDDDNVPEKSDDSVQNERHEQIDVQSDTILTTQRPTDEQRNKQSIL